MSAIPKVIKWGFDPSQSNIPVLKTEMGRKIWGYIKHSHLADQYFNDNVMCLVGVLALKQPVDGKELWKMAACRGFRNVGVKSCGTGDYRMTTDEEWWQGLYDFIYDIKDIPQEFPQ